MKLQKGNAAPEFEGIDQNGQPIKLDEFKGKKLVLYFYPKDSTPSCTAQACNLRDHYETLRTQGCEVVGISTDSAKSHQNFIKKQMLPFRLITDPDQKIHELFGTWGEKTMYGRKYMGTIRTTFIIDENGIIADIIEKVNTKEHASQIYDSLN
jgi:thioredoxin-dependent peroxiredoxin